MPRFDDLIRQIGQLDPLDQEELMLFLSGGFSSYPFRSKSWRTVSQGFPSIVSTPDVCGGAARLIRTRIPIWTLERMRQLGVSEADILKSYPNLQAVDLVQAWSYANRNRDEIEQAIARNEQD